ncbi:MULTISPECIES: P-loop NTPase fold protein [unclassified Rathayibacter]|uniref:P-loop NTPase fold protein n=1 Tax=unclassified Rathayibacter TaxID=2609250 RepID=UPI000CE87978|nr:MULTISPECIES: P-loop NTPase fold protein [unclassified Rathayibacter]PPF14310.1 hypothetical protein C5B92_15215 [Rathayibacter sp. AY1A4]PPG79952.1 hypothetical protein C5C52_11360 [Rathayibacter sp. AY1E5]PPH65505.1 hypothetical protein C5D25_04090 [Rathayibacter sp. AY1D7]PPI29420.1 hypothetical protein C5D66_11360 [Rathayibacter sp. AY1B4]
MNQAQESPAVSPLTPEDIVPDEPLQGVGRAAISAEQDLLHHRVIARRIAELAVSASGKVNVALFGPWGSGKSSFNALLKEELAAVDRSVGHITFDAWKNSGEGFRANFLSELARQISPKNDHIPDQLFQGTTKVSFPLGATYVSTKTRRIATSILLPLALLLLFLGGPLLWALAANAVEPSKSFVGLWWQNIQGWSAFGVSSTLIVVVLAGLIELSKVTVSQSMPSHVAQFSKLFDQLLAAGQSKRYVVFIDELDRCSPDDVVKTLEGLRTFLGDKRCVFVVAFDREAVAETISKHLRHEVPHGPAAPYYGTSGEYLDKIFQFQLSLPPQAAHTFRRYALSLVSAKGGVWAELGAYRENLLERVVTVLAPMHLASPRRTKVLLNEFAVTARIYQSLGFEWVQFAEEIAILAVLRTEFPHLMTDVERTPALMRFLYRNESSTRPEVAKLLAKYSEPDPEDEDASEPTQLDRVIANTDTDAVSDQLLVNLHRYLRRLRELRAPEPRAELIMMHSGGALVHFEDPAVYDAVLLAPDASRRDVVAELAAASESDRSQAIQHILEQAERESAQIAEHLRILAGDLSSVLTVVPVPLSDALRAAVTSGFDGHSEDSLRGYAGAISVAFTIPSATELLDAAERSQGSAGSLVVRFVETLTENDWHVAQALLTSKALRVVLTEPEVLETVLRRVEVAAESSLSASDLAILTAELSVSKPAEVTPESATVAARQAANEENEAATEAFEAAVAETREATTRVLLVWDHLQPASGLRRDLLRVLRNVRDDSQWHLDQHDALVTQVRDGGDMSTANQYLLDAIAEHPEWAAGRWRKMLTMKAPVKAIDKSNALRAVVHRATNATRILVSENGATNSLSIANLISPPISAAPLVEMVREDLDKEWEEYSDNRFEYQWTLLAALDAIEDSTLSTLELRAHLVVDAVGTAAEDGASVDAIVRAVGTVSDEQCVSIANILQSSNLWEEDDSFASQQVLLTTQLRMLSFGISVHPLPSSALGLITDVEQRASLGQLWLQTAPAAQEIEKVLADVTFSNSAWGVYSRRSTIGERAKLWEALWAANASPAALRALSSAGMPSDIYEKAAGPVTDAQNTKARRMALDVFLTLPPGVAGTATARELIKVMSTEAKLTQVPLGVDLLRAYAPFWPVSTRSGLRGRLTPWMEAGKNYTTKSNLNWLMQEGFISKKSSLFEKLLGI